MPKDREPQRPTDDDTDAKVSLLQKMIEENVRRRAAEGLYGEVVICMIWVEGRLKEFRFKEESIIRDSGSTPSKN